MCIPKVFLYLGLTPGEKLHALNIQLELHTFPPCIVLQTCHVLRDKALDAEIITFPHPPTPIILIYFLILLISIFALEMQILDLGELRTPVHS